MSRVARSLHRAAVDEASKWEQILSSEGLGTISHESGMVSLDSLLSDGPSMRGDGQLTVDPSMGVLVDEQSTMAVIRGERVDMSAAPCRTVGTGLVGTGIDCPLTVVGPVPTFGLSCAMDSGHWGACRHEPIGTGVGFIDWLGTGRDSRSWANARSSDAIGRGEAWLSLVGAMVHEVETLIVAHSVDRWSEKSGWKIGTLETIETVERDVLCIGSDGPIMVASRVAGPRARVDGLMRGAWLVETVEDRSARLAMSARRSSVVTNAARQVGKRKRAAASIPMLATRLVDRGRGLAAARARYEACEATERQAIAISLGVDAGASWDVVRAAASVRIGTSAASLADALACHGAGTMGTTDTRLVAV